MLLIYFFKVLLAQYKSVKAEIIQIQLRQTLCQFIQSYAEYAKEIKSKDASALEKFENVIFSGITPSSDKIPSTFDGMDQITKLLKEIKK
jgi:transcriptional regulator of heat shock response